MDESLPTPAALEAATEIHAECSESSWPTAYAMARIIDRFMTPRASANTPGEPSIPKYYTDGKGLIYKTVFGMPPRHRNNTQLVWLPSIFRTNSELFELTNGLVEISPEEGEPLKGGQ